MLLAVLVLLTIAATAVISFALGYRWAKRRGARWLVRPHSKRTLARMVDPDQQPATVVEASWARTNMPSSTSTME